MKTKNLLTAVVFLFVIADAFAQTPSWAWARGAGSISNDYSNATCSDANGNVYITGTFQGSTITFGSDTLHNAGTGSLDIFIAKYDASGNVLWARSGGGTSNDYAYGICTDTKGNVYITGYFRDSSITFGTITLTNSDSTGGSTDIFITKYDSDGNILWARRAGGNDWDLSYGTCTDPDNNVYITGAFASATFILGRDTLTNIGEYTIFIAKYDADGNVIWAKEMGGGGDDSGQGICADASGNVYVTGWFQSPAVFGSDTLMTHNYVNVFVAKYDTYGNNLWARSADGGHLDTQASGSGISVDAGGNIYITGYYNYFIAFGNDSLGNADNYSIFIAKYDSSGNALWGRSPGGTNYDYGTSICTDANGNVFTTGYFSSSFLNFGGIPVLNANVGYDDIFVAEYDASGNALMAGSVGGQDNDYGMGICASSGSTGSDVYVTGYFGSYSLNFGSTTLTNNGSYDVFLAKLSTLVGIEPLSNNDEILIYPNPANGEFNIYTSHFPIERIELFNMLGERVYGESAVNRNQETVSCKLSSGIYIVQVKSGDRFYTGKVAME